MKNIYHLVVEIIFIISISACASDKTSTPSLDVGGTFTAVANTIIAGQPTIAVDNTSTPEPTEIITATLFPTIQSTVTMTSTPYTYYYDYYTATMACDDATLISETLDDGTEIYPEDYFTQTWKLYNSGSCTWDDDYSIIFVSGDNMDGEDKEIGSEVDPGEYIKITIGFYAPDDEDDYTGYWQLENDDGDQFGDLCDVSIEVDDGASTSTPTKTATYTKTNTATSTGTATKTPTPTPITVTVVANTYTSTPVPTSMLTSTPLPTFTPTNTALLTSIQATTIAPTEIPPTTVPTEVLPTEVPEATEVTPLE